MQLGLDDFGMGYSALSYLHQFPFQTIKIDRAFVSGIQDGGNTEIIRAIVALAAGLGMDVTAEGIETMDQVDRLHELACEYGQGYYFNKPLTPEDARGILAGHVRGEPFTLPGETRVAPSEAAPGPPSAIRRAALRGARRLPPPAAAADLDRRDRRSGSAPPERDCSG